MELDRDYPHAVDIPIPPTGLGVLLPVILDTASALPGGSKVSAYGEPEGAEVRQWFERVATKTPADAAKLAWIFRSIGARRVG